MTKHELARPTGILDKLTCCQRKALAADSAALESKTAPTKVVESRMAARPDCSHCASRQVVKNGSADGLKRFKCRHLGRKPLRHGGKASKPGRSNEQVLVLIARDCAGSTANFILESTSSAAIGTALKPILPIDTIVRTDSSIALAAAVRALDVKHHSLNVRADVRIDGA